MLIKLGKPIRLLGKGPKKDIQNFSSLAFPVWDWQCFEYISTNHDLVALLTLITGVIVEQPGYTGSVNYEAS